MDTLFTAELVQNGQNKIFDVFFEQDRYIFKSQDDESEFGIKREDDEWHPDRTLDDQLREAAINQLESYLLSQH